MSESEVVQAEKTLIEKERKYSELMRKSYEISLNNRTRAAKFHEKAKCLYREIMNTRQKLNLDYV